MGKEETGNGKDEQSMREHWLSDLAPLSDAAQELFSGNEIPMSEEETADLLNEAGFRFPKNQPIEESKDALLQEALVLGSPVDGDQDPDAPQLSEDKMQILLSEVTKQLGMPPVHSSQPKTKKAIPFKPILFTFGVTAAVMLGFFIFKGDPLIESGGPDAVAQDVIDGMPKGGAIVLAFNGEVQASEMDGNERSELRSLVDRDLLGPGTELVTGPDSEAVLLLTNGSLATLGSSSRMKLTEFAQEAFEETEEKILDLTNEPSQSQVLLDLDFGDLVVDVKKLDKKSSFDVHSPLVVVGIRGTQYRILATDRSARISVLEGKVAVSKERGGLDHLIESERAILLEEDLQKEPDGATVEELERIKRVNERARKLAEKIELKDLAEAYDEINKRLALALVEKKLEQAMNKAIDEGIHIVESAANMEMIWCKPGTFMMGSPETEKGRFKDEIQRKVTLTQGFFLGKYEVTQNEYQIVTGKNPSAFRGKKLPIETATWKEAKEFCEKLTEQENKSGRLPEGWIFTLPSEAQWEYACRAGTKTTYFWGKEINPKLANYNNSKIGKTKEVGSYKANPWGFYDMTGNVWEWCYDWWQKSISREDQIDPFGPKSGSYRAKRGGSWVGPGSFLRSADRDNGSHKSNRNVGFRLCLRQITDSDKLANLSSKVDQIPGLVRHWKFEEEEGNVSKATVGNFDAKLMGGAHLVPGKIGNAVEVDGETGYVDFGMGAGDTDGNFTVSFFVKYLGKDPPGNYPKLMTNKKSYNSDDGWHFHLMSKREKWGAGSMWVRGSSGKGFGKKVNDDWKAGNWHHLLVSFEGEKVSIHSDGKSSGTGKITSVMNGLRNFTFSTKLKGYGFHGQLDDLRIYDRLLTESEIIDIYEMGEFASKLASVDAKDDSKNGLTLVEKKFEDAMKKPVGEGIHIVESAANMEMIWCKPGSFLMGSPKSQKGRSISGTQYKVSLTEGFYLGKYEVTQEEYEKVMGKNSSNFKGKKLPVEMVSWNDAMEFCKKLTGLEKKEGRVPDGWTYILPTEAQWEYACRAGTTTFYSWGNEINLKLANYRDSKIGKTSEVGFYQSNPWGLFDMHGNVWEWVHDWQGNYPREAVNNPHGPASGSARAGRGGSWSATGMSLRSAERYGYTPSKHSRNIGFRVCFKQEIDDEK